MTSIAFIGLGNMGAPMCRHLIQAGHSVSGFDQSIEKRAAIAQLGGQPADTLQQAVGAAECVITMLPTGRHVREVYEGPGGVLESVAPGVLLIDSSTIDVESAKAVSAAAAAAGFTMVDAPSPAPSPQRRPGG